MALPWATVLPEPRVGNAPFRSRQRQHTERARALICGRLNELEGDEVQEPQLIHLAQINLGGIFQNEPSDIFFSAT